MQMQPTLLNSLSQSLAVPARDYLLLFTEFEAANEWANGEL